MPGDFIAGPGEWQGVDRARGDGSNGDLRYPIRLRHSHSQACPEDPRAVLEPMSGTQYQRFPTFAEMETSKLGELP